MPRHALDDLAHQVAVGQPVIARARPRLVDGRRALDGVDHVLPVEHALGAVDHLPDVVEARLVRQDVAHGDALLPCLRELGPVVARPARRSRASPRSTRTCSDGRGDPLRGREARRHRVALPRACPPRRDSRPTGRPRTRRGGTRTRPRRPGTVRAGCAASATGMKSGWTKPSTGGRPLTRRPPPRGQWPPSPSRPATR